MSVYYVCIYVFFSQNTENSSRSLEVQVRTELFDSRSHDATVFVGVAAKVLSSLNAFAFKNLLVMFRNMSIFCQLKMNELSLQFSDNSNRCMIIINEKLFWINILEIVSFYNILISFLDVYLLNGLTWKCRFLAILMLFNSFYHIYFSKKELASSPGRVFPIREDPFIWVEVFSLKDDLC